MRIRWLIHIGGMVEGREGGVKPGDIMDVPDVNGARYVAFGNAVKVDDEPVEEHAVPPEPEIATVDEDGEHAEPPEPEKAVTRPPVARRPRPARK